MAEKQMILGQILVRGFGITYLHMKNVTRNLKEQIKRYHNE